MTPEMQIPKPPAILPAQLQKQWAKTYSDALAQARTDEPEDTQRQKMLAGREANRMLRTPNLTSYDGAMNLLDWQVISRGEADGVLKVVTIDGKKYRFPVPARKAEGGSQKAEAAKS